MFAQKGLNGIADGVLFGNPAQLGIQAVAVGAAIVYSGVGSFVLLKLVGLIFPLRADARPRASAWICLSTAKGRTCTQKDRGPYDVVVLRVNRT